MWKSSHFARSYSQAEPVPSVEDCAQRLSWSREYEKFVGGWRWRGPGKDEERGATLLPVAQKAELEWAVGAGRTERAGLSPQLSD